MLKNSQYVIYSYGIFSVVVVVYTVAVLFKLKQVTLKLKNLGGESNNEK